MSLPTMPRIDTLRLAVVTAVPSFHPEHDAFRPFPVNAFVVHHPDGAIVIDTGIGFDNPFIDELYPHTAERLIYALNRVGVDERAVQCIVNSHLHFDHCGQNAALSCPIVVQRAELEAARHPHYTVPEWAAMPTDRERVIDGDHEVARGVTALLTPGHTPGHQAVVIRGGDETVVVAAQCIFRRAAWHAGAETANVHDETWREAAADSLARLRAIRPARVLLSHDAPLDAGDLRDDG